MTAALSQRFAGYRDDIVYLDGSDVTGFALYVTSEGIPVTAVCGPGWACGVLGHPVDVALRLALRPREVRGHA